MAALRAVNSDKVLSLEGYGKLQKWLWLAICFKPQTEASLDVRYDLVHSFELEEKYAEAI
jgi:hypothetical protein